MLPSIVHHTNIIDYDTINSLKNRIESYREKEVEGIRVRSRIQDNINCEHISRYLISKQKELGQKKIITKMIDNNGTLLTSTSAIQKHGVRFYKNLYSKALCDAECQSFFLSLLHDELSDVDRMMLSAPISKEETYKALTFMALNKTPGIDGLPAEFYVKNWEDISDTMIELYAAILYSGNMGASQRKGIINLIPKSSDLLYIENFRPISLLCVDYKILAKVMSERIKKVLCKVINNKQFCGIPGRSINQCNMELRDLIYYVNDSNLDLAFLNLDWYKAFDLVPIDFVYNILLTLGFGEQFVGYIKTLYNGIGSSLTINNVMSDFFPVCRSVRQGCPLSMNLFIIFQEPLYRAVIASRIIRPLTLPDSSKIKILGYADDTTLIITDERSLLEAFNLIKIFEKATGSKLNINKTKIYGAGNWRGKDQWPIAGLQTETEDFYTLGIYHCNDYRISVDKNWNNAIEKIKKHTNILHNRKLNLHQRSIYANTCILSKLWYISHVYPLPENQAKCINSVVFNYIWGGRYEPIKRTVLCQAKKEGGLAVMNCLLKSRTLMVSTFLKCYNDNNYRNSLMFYYCYIRLSNILPSEYSIHNASHIATPYYDEVIRTTQSILHLPGFPFVSKENIYKNMLPKVKPTAELQYPTFNWENIWKNYANIFIQSHDKEIIYKHLHMCLTTNQRLFTLNLTNSSKCNKCIENREETSLHLFYQCDYAKPIFLWILRCLFHICNFNPSSNIRFLYFDNEFSNTFQRNICNIFIYIYVITIWRCRKENLRIGDLKHLVIRKLNEYRTFLKQMPNQKYKQISEQLSGLNIED